MWYKYIVITASMKHNEGGGKSSPACDTVSGFCVFKQEDTKYIIDC